MSTAPPPAWLRGLAAQLPLTTPGLPRGVFRPPGAGTRRAGVLVLFGEGPEGVDLLLTQRASTLRKHAGQVAFPGGRVDPDDDGPVAAALREAQEETGLEPAGVEVLATGPDLYVPVTDFLVTTVLGWWRDPSPVGVRDPGEVARVERVPVAELVDPANRVRMAHPSGFVGPGFLVRGLVVWGFTAGVLTGMLGLAGLERPWDQSRVLPVPDEALGGGPGEPA